MPLLSSVHKWLGGSTRISIKIKSAARIVLEFKTARSLQEVWPISQMLAPPSHHDLAGVGAALLFASPWSERCSAMFVYSSGLRIFTVMRNDDPLTLARPPANPPPEVPLHISSAASDGVHDEADVGHGL
jgi:hypothetical protein